MRAIVVVVAALTVAVLVPTARSGTIPALRAHLYATDPCLASIVDREQGGPAWSATVYNGGAHWTHGPMLASSYGLPQAQPGWKMASAGPDWRTNPVTQLRWMRGYVRGRYGSSCAAWGFWQAHGWY